MKSVKLFSAFAFATTMFFNTVSANNIENTYDVSGTVVKIAAKSTNITVDLDEVKKEEISIKIVDENQNILVNETVKDVKKYVRKYNVSRLIDGSYSLVVTKKTVRTTQPFTIERGEVMMSEMEKKEKFIPTLNFKNDKLDVNVLLSNYSNITVKLYDNEGRQIMEDKYLAEFKLNKRYDLSRIAAGAYIAEVSAGDETFNYSIVK